MPWFFGGKKKKKAKKNLPPARAAAETRSSSNADGSSGRTRRSLVQPEGKVPLDASARQSLNAAMAAQAAGIVRQRKSAKGIKVDLPSEEEEKPSSRTSNASNSEQVDAPRLSVHSLKTRPVVPRGSRRRPTMQRQFEGKAAEELLKSAGVDGDSIKPPVRRTKSTPARGLQPVNSSGLPATSPLRMNLTLDRKREQRKKSEIIIHPLSLRMKQGYEFFENEGVTYRVRSGWRKSLSATKGYDGYGLYRKKTERDWEIVRDLDLKTQLLDQLKLVRRSSSRSSLHRNSSITGAAAAAEQVTSDPRLGVMRSQSATTALRRDWSSSEPHVRKGSPLVTAEKGESQEVSEVKDNPSAPPVKGSESDGEEEEQESEEEEESDATEEDENESQSETKAVSETDDASEQSIHEEQNVEEEIEEEKEEAESVSAPNDQPGPDEDVDLKGAVAEIKNDISGTESDSPAAEEPEPVMEPVATSSLPDGAEDGSVSSKHRGKHKKGKKKKKHKKKKEKKHKKHRHRREKETEPESYATLVPSESPVDKIDLKQRRKSVRDLAAMFESKGQVA